MKKMMTRNKVVVTVLALLIALAGYLNYTDMLKDDGGKSSSKTQQALGDSNLNYTYDVVNGLTDGDNSYNAVYGDDDLLDSDGDIASQDAEETVTDDLSKDEEETTAEPGAAIFTNGNSSYSSTMKAKVNREQIRSKNKEDLLKIVDNENLDDEQKQQAVDAMVELTKCSEMENNIETILEAKGYDDVIVSISDNQADVVVLENKIGDSDRAVIEDVITRKTDISLDGIVITPTN